MKDVEIIKARNVLSSRARTNLAKRLRVAAYCRVSTDSEDQLNSYKSQVQHYSCSWRLASAYCRCSWSFCSASCLYSAFRA